ncbi:MAG: hypothetical protein IT363_14120 [Methanoregulaceae archaeon]|jgi:hypothetical protein|nr:hypothetical protein [Methanoregulaceae archaeon]
MEIQEALRPATLQIVAIAGAAVALYFFWRLCRAVVKWGFFIAYFVMGALLTWFFQPGMSIGLTLAGGLGFAWTVMAIKSKLWRLIGAIAVIAAVPFAGPFSEKIAEWAFPDEKPAGKAPPAQQAKSKK